jgi:hypothetical protein
LDDNRGLYSDTYPELGNRGRQSTVGGPLKIAAGRSKRKGQAKQMGRLGHNNDTNKNKNDVSSIAYANFREA